MMKGTHDAVSVQNRRASPGAWLSRAAATARSRPASCGSAAPAPSARGRRAAKSAKRRASWSHTAMQPLVWYATCTCAPCWASPCLALSFAWLFKLDCLV